MHSNSVVPPRTNVSEPPVAVLRLGRIVTTRAAREIIDDKDILAAIQRHQAGDWGEVSESDRKANDQALVAQGRITSFYRTAHGASLFVETEPDRSLTTIFLPEET
jgi:hypothetical protein